MKSMIEFDSSVVRETAYGVVEDYGIRKNRMTLNKVNLSQYFIEWEVFDKGTDSDVIDYVEIGVFTDNIEDPKKVVDCDGVFEVPKQAIQLLKDNGFDTKEIE